ncbi:MAG TPA: A24 family peptidase [bacterium]|nr:A24 family peptidase [bacterium]
MWPLTINIALAVLVAASVATDIKLRKIHNAVTMPAILSGLILNALNDGASGAMFSLYGILLATGMMALPFIMKGIGGGDLKMLAAIGALKGHEFVFIVFVAGGIMGGIIAALSLNTRAKRKASINQIKNMCLTFGQESASVARIDTQDSSNAIPYAVAIATGTAVAILVAPISLF